MYTKSREDYLRGLYVLEEEKKELKASDLANYLAVSKSSISEMMRKLDSEKLVRYTRYAKLQFTPKGRTIAKRLTSKHRIIELFLKDTLKMNVQDIHQEAHHLEHAFSDESIERLRAFLGNPKFDPHGKPIP